MKYKIGDNVILNDDVEFWFKKAGGCEVAIVDTTSCSYKIKIGENQYVFIDDNSINHKATSELKNKFRYKVGDRVKTLEKIPYSAGADEVANQIYTIEEVDAKDERLPYRIKHRCWAYWINDDCIDHEATATLNFKVDKDKFDEAISSMAYAVQDLGASMRENLNIVCNKIRCSKGGETMNANEILNTWERRKRNKIELERNEKTEQITRNDEIKKLIEKHVAQINKTIKEKYNTALEARNICAVLTPETEEKLKVVNHESETQKLNIESKVKDIKAILEVAENQDKVFEILNKQGIIDKNYNIL